MSLTSQPPKPAPDFQVTGVSLKAETEKFIGPCPAVLKFDGNVTVNAPGTVKYSFVRSDGASGPVEVLHFDSAGTRTVSTVWTLGGPGLTVGMAARKFNNKERPAERSSTIGFDESPAGYSLASCSPAELASASPAAHDSE